MLHTRKRITRKQLRQPDRFFNLTASALRVIQRQRNWVVVGLSVVVAAYLGLWGWRTYQANQEIRAARAYSAALEAYREANYERSLDLLSRVDPPSSSIYKSLVLLYEARIHLALNRPAQAIRLLDEYIRRRPDASYLEQIGLVTLGHALEASGECRTARESYEKAAQFTGPLKAEAMLSRARCAAEIGDLREAADLYREYLAGFPGAGDELEITMKIEELEVKIGAAGA